MSEQLNLFDYQTAQKEVANLPKTERHVIHHELIKFLEYTALRSNTDHEYACELEIAYNRNNALAENLIQNCPPYVLGVGIIYFLAQLEDNKKIYNKRLKGMRTYTMDHLFQAERGLPYEFFEVLMEFASEEAKALSKYSNIISSLLLKNIGQKEGKKEKFFLHTLEMIGTKKDVPVLKQYLEEVFQGNFGHAAYITTANSAIPVQGAVKDSLRNKLVKRIQKVINKLSKR